jgi:hypothetical protein
MSSPRPRVICLVAKPLPLGEVTDMWLVPLERVPARLAEGWVMVGPDPASEIALHNWIQEAKWALGPGESDAHGSDE